MADPALIERLEAEVERIGSTEFGRSDIDALLLEGGRHFGLAKLELDEDGIAVFTIGDEIDLFVSFQPGFPGVLAVAPLPDGSPLRAQLLRRLLVVNLSAAAAGAAFSLMPPSDTLVLSRRIDLSHRDTARFVDELTAFADAANQWREEIELFADVVEQSDDEDADQEPPVKAAAANTTMLRA